MDKSHYLDERREELIYFREVTKDILCDDIYIHIWSLIRKEFDIKPVKDGEICKWHRNRLLHRDYDLPAYISETVMKWYQNGVVHRDGDLPAIIYLNTKKRYWVKNGRVFRDGDKPAYYDDLGNKAWVQNNLLFREYNKPTIEKRNGILIWADNKKYLYIIRKNYFTDIIKRSNINYAINIYGTQYWFINNQLGRKDDLPSIVYLDGTRIWYKDDYIYRQMGSPAIIYASGEKRHFVIENQIYYPGVS